MLNYQRVPSMGMDDPGESSPSQLCRTYREVLIMRYPGLVNVYITNWKDPPCYSWENPRTFDWAMASIAM